MIFYNGHTGSIGKYLEPLLKNKSLAYHILKTRLENYAQINEELKTIDLKNDTEVVLISLAALVSVPECEKNPEKAHLVNVVHTTKFVSEWIQFFKNNHPHIHLKILYASSSHVYKTPKTEHKIAPQNETDPQTVYAKTKLEAEKSLRTLCNQEKATLIVARVFGVVAPIQPQNYLLQGLIKRAKTENLFGITGLKNKRDYLDSRDICSAFLKIIESSQKKEAPEVLNVCSGVPVLIEDLLLKVLKSVDKEQLMKQVTPDKSEHYDSPWIVGDASETEQFIGGKIQEISLEQTIQDALLKSV